MKKLSKERWRQIYGIREPKDPEDPSVVARRALHELIIKWELKWLTRLHLISAFSAFAIVLLPLINEPWHAFITSVAVFSWIHNEFSRFGAVLIISLAPGLFFYFRSIGRIDGKSYSEHGYPINLRHVGSPRDVIQGELYPRVWLEEKVFFSDCVAGIWVATVAWFVLFGGLSILIKSGVR